MERQRTKLTERPFIAEEPLYKWVRKGKATFTLRDGRVIHPGQEFEAPLSLIPAPFRNMFVQKGMILPEEQNAVKTAAKQAETKHVPVPNTPQTEDVGKPGDEQSIEDAVDVDALPEVDVDAHSDKQNLYKPVFVSSGYYHVVNTETGLPVQEGKKFRLAKANELCEELNTL